MKKLCLMAVSLVCMMPLSALADRNGHGHGHGYNNSQHTEHQWRSGSWHHGSHSGRSGWWWIVNGIYYPYAQRSNAYPVYQETVVIERQQPAPQPTIIVQQPAPQPSYPQSSTLPPTGVQQSAPNLWYYCDAARMYYPYVDSCSSGWRAVPAVPPSGVIR